MRREIVSTEPGIYSDFKPLIIQHLAQNPSYDANYNTTNALRRSGNFWIRPPTPIKH
jgi:hypothetical protein